jgi:S1-C subfamily serine protease
MTPDAGRSESAAARTEAAEAAALDAYSRVVVDVAARVRPSVASLRVTSARGRGGRREVGAGSGVVLTDDGLVVTSAHVVARGDGGRAVLDDDRELMFEVIGRDALSDLAVLRVPAGDLPAAALGDARGLRVGQLVVAVGNPLGMAGSVSAGVVSALGRSLPASDGRAARLISGVVQTDAALHPGSSGGALADSSGHVVGINTALLGPTVGQGLGLAVPVNPATRMIIAELIARGRYERAYLGVTGGGRPLPPRVRAAAGSDSGIELLSVLPGSPAADAGLRVEDIIVRVGDTAVRDIAELQHCLDAARAGGSVTLTVVRGGEVAAVPVRLAALDEAGATG